MSRAERALVALLLLAASACTIVRVYVGAPLSAAPDGGIVLGQTTRGEVLALYGAPARIFRHAAGDVFVYTYTRRNSASLDIEEPVITNLQIFSYTRVQEREDRLVVIFDESGRVDSFGRFESTPALD